MPHLPQRLHEPAYPCQNVPGSLAFAETLRAASNQEDFGFTIRAMLPQHTPLQQKLMPVFARPGRDQVAAGHRSLAGHVAKSAPAIRRMH